MASRRVRIKGIANIPQRRKPANGTNAQEDENKVAKNSTEDRNISNLNSTEQSHVGEQTAILDAKIKDTESVVINKTFEPAAVQRSVDVKISRKIVEANTHTSIVSEQKIGSSLVKDRPYGKSTSPVHLHSISHSCQNLPTPLVSDDLHDNHLDVTSAEILDKPLGCDVSSSVSLDYKVIEPIDLSLDSKQIFSGNLSKTNIHISTAHACNNSTSVIVRRRPKKTATSSTGSNSKNCTSNISASVTLSKSYENETRLNSFNNLKTDNISTINVANETPYSCIIHSNKTLDKIIENEKSTDKSSTNTYKSDNQKSGLQNFSSEETITCGDLTSKSENLANTSKNDISHDSGTKNKLLNQVPASRRRFIKPTISVNVINRKPKDKCETVKNEQFKENLHEQVNINLNETIISPNASTSPLIQKVDSSVGPFTSKLGISQLPKQSTDTYIKVNLDKEYTHAPSSPSKILNRSRIKAVPRLGQRRTSFSVGSASESEDDGRRSYSRIRNDSVCSVTSGINDNQSVTDATSPVRKEFISAIQRKCKRTEQSRKLAEARREFQMKFNNGIPDKQKLTMIDLIFYNPSGNPMSQKKKRKMTESEESVENTTNKIQIANKLEKEEEERLDDPLALSENEDNENMLAPQIKIGPNGEITIDEKSLVIESAATKRGRKALQDSELVDGDFDTSYGVFKKVKRSKDWTKAETLRFYKALNTIGTDFTMMCELFPGRTRRELKMKFKKEERMNRNLIDRAVMQPVAFDMTSLRQDLEKEERTLEEMKNRKKERNEMKEQINQLHVKKKNKIKGIESISDDEDKVKVVKVAKKTKKKSKSAYDAVKSGINGLLDESDDEITHSYNKITNTKQIDSDKEECKNQSLSKYISEDESDKNVEKISISKPTRSGRIPKTKQQFVPTEYENTRSKSSNRNTRQIGKLPKVRKPKEIKPSTTPSGGESQNLEPGSLMIVSSKMPSGEMVYKVFMITDQQNKQQINLDPEMLQNLTQGVGHKYIQDLNAQNILAISAQETIQRQTNLQTPADTNAVVNVTNEIITADNIEDTGQELQATNVPTVRKVNTSDNMPIQSRPDDYIEITSDSIIFPFEECIANSNAQNITISHDENKMVIVTEDNSKQEILGV